MRRPCAKLYAVDLLLKTILLSHPLPSKVEKTENLVGILPGSQSPSW